MTYITYDKYKKYDENIELHKNNLVGFYAHYYTSSPPFKENKIYKITKNTNKYLTFEELEIENELNISKNIYDCFNYTDEYIYYKNTSNLKKIKFSIENLKGLYYNFFVFDDITNYYIKNKRLINNYNLSKFKNDSDYLHLEGYLFRIIKSIFYNLEDSKKYEIIKNYIDILYNKHKDILVRFLDEIKEMNLNKEYNAILSHYNDQYFLDFRELILNETCPICLSNKIKVYKDFYNCCHCCCFECFKNWKVRTCPLCRAIEKVFFF